MRKLYSTLAAIAAVALALPGEANAQQKVVIGIPTSPPNIVHMPVIVLMILGVSLTTLLKWAGRRIAPWSHGNR